MWLVISGAFLVAVAFYQVLRFISASGSSEDQTLKQELLDLSQSQKTIIYFLRHGGCIFCYEGLCDFKKFLADLKVLPYVVVVLLDDIHLESVKRDLKPICGDRLRVIVDDGGLYRSFGLPRGKFLELFSFATFRAGIRAMKKIPNYRLKKPLSDGFQMGGFFLLESGQIVSQFIGEHAGDQRFFAE